jgi:hypothetical protein
VAADEDARETSFVIALNNPLSEGQAQEACRQLETLLTSGCSQQVICDVSGQPNLRTVDLLARLALLSQRGNSRLVIRAVEDDQNLERLIALTGLECLDRHQMERLEVRRQSEAGE